MSKITGAAVRVRSHKISAVALGTDAAVLADTALDAANPTVVTVFVAQPDTPRNVTIKGNAAAVTGNVVIAGKNSRGAVITETIALNAANMVTGNKAFASISSISLPKWASANTERVRVGFGQKIGLLIPLDRDTIVNAYLGGVREGTRPTVAFNATDPESNTVTLNSALNGSAVIVDYYETIS